METISKITMRGLPLFPLPDFFLFPGAVAPLHIFEQRYRRMVNDLLDTSGRLVLAAYCPEALRADTGPVVMPVAGLGEIVHHETLADGRYLIWVLGLARVAVSEVPSKRPYRLTDARPCADLEVDPTDGTELESQLRDAIVNRAPRGDALDPDGLPLGLLADILLNALPLDATRTAAVFAERCPQTRARQALAWDAEANRWQSRNTR